MGLSLMGRLFARPDIEHVNVALSLLAHVVSGILSRSLSSPVFRRVARHFCALLYLGSVWGYQVSLFLGHVIFAQMWFLLALAR